mgnify:CR=1 FL=1
MVKSVLYKSVDLYEYGSPVLFSEFIEAPEPYKNNYSKTINGIFYFDYEENVYIMRNLYQGDEVDDNTFKHSVKTKEIKQILNAINKYKKLRKLRILFTTLYLLHKHYYDVMEYTYRPGNNGYLRVKNEWNHCMIK